MKKTNKGYSLIEIAVGILMLTIFLLVSIGLFNGCYNNYRRIKQRNIALDRAVYYIENMLQTDSDVLTGFFVQKLNPATNAYSLSPSTLFSNFVDDCITDDSYSAYGVKERYAAYKGIDESEIPATISDLDKYIFKDKEYLVNAYIKYDVNENIDIEHNPNHPQLNNGSYGFILNDENNMNNSTRYDGDEKYTIVLNNELTQPDIYEYVASNGGAFKVVKTISRIPVINGKAYGNNVLSIKVDVYYTKDFSNALSPENTDIVTIETIKL